MEFIISKMYNLLTTVSIKQKFETIVDLCMENDPECFKSDRIILFRFDRIRNILKLVFSFVT